MPVAGAVPSRRRATAAGSLSAVARASFMPRPSSASRPPIFSAAASTATAATPSATCAVAAFFTLDARPPTAFSTPPTTPLGPAPEPPSAASDVAADVAADDDVATWSATLPAASLALAACSSACLSSAASCCSVATISALQVSTARAAVSKAPATSPTAVCASSRWPLPLPLKVCQYAPKASTACPELSAVTRWTDSPQRRVRRSASLPNSRQTPAALRRPSSSACGHWWPVLASTGTSSSGSFRDTRLPPSSLVRQTDMSLGTAVAVPGVAPAVR